MVLNNKDMLATHSGVQLTSSSSYVLHCLQCEALKICGKYSLDGISGKNDWIW